MSKLADQIHDFLKTKGLKPGEVLPGLEQLAAQLGNNQDAIGGAVSELVYEGTLERRYSRKAQEVAVSTSGKLGVLGGILSLTKEAVKRGMTPGSEVLNFAIVPCGKLLAEKLHIEPGEEVIIVERLRTVDGEPVALETSNIPRKYMPEVNADMFEAKGAAASSFDLLDKSGIHLVKGEDIVSAVAIEKREAGLLNMKEGDPILQRDRTTWDDKGRLAKWSRAFFKAKSQYDLALR
jgi:GntR family transcriptional regulator